MSQADYDRWVAAGRPFTLVRPLRELRDLLRGYGYVVYDIGNMDHLLHEPPEDHTPYSATGWPGTARYGYGYAVDIMPPAAGSGLPSLARLGAQLHADRQAGLIPWLKYMNWEPDGPGGRCLHCSWQPGHAQRDSSDRGHIHASARTGYEETSAAGYDPVARIRGEDMLTAEDLDRIARRVWTWDLRNGEGVDEAYRVLNRAAAAAVAAAGADPVDEAAVAGELLKVLTPATIAAALPDEVAREVADEIGRRMSA